MQISNQQTFLFDRGFIDYHSDRFQDFSLMIYKNEKLLALLPANLFDNVLYSHQGLTYGGLIYHENLKTEDFLRVFEAILKFLYNKEIKELILKEIPVIYLKNSSNNPMNYLFFKTKAKLLRTDMHSVVNLDFKSFSSSRKEGIRRGRKNNLKIRESDNLDSFWHNILIPNLKSKHGVKPVHTLEEITLLKKRFPNSIRQFNVYYQDKLVGGTTVFESKNVAHCQYISADIDKNKLGSLDFLHAYLIDNVYNDKLYFSFGTSNVQDGKKINKGLQFWKEGFGARSITQGFYKIDIANYKSIEDLYL